MFSPTDVLRRTLVRQVRDKFNDRSKGESPVPASDTALYSRGSVVWRVHGDVTSMMVGGVAALLTQMLHPAALGGVWDHSDVVEDQLGRLRRTARFIAVTTYGDRAAAEQAIAMVRSIHQRVGGTLPDGTAYRADDPALLAWVHVAGAILFLDGWRRYAEPRMSRSDQDRYFAEGALVAELLGADPVPKSRSEAEQLIDEFRPQLRADQRTSAFRQIVLDSPAPTLKDAPVQKLLMAAAVDLLPPFAREMHGLKRQALPPLAVRSATFALAGTLRWAFATQSYR
ncbi:MAG: DUF2236 domain-containing protein [Sphingomonas sp.]|nr:DUF2236 domain-containing protein [Sphingomonas sp.]